MFQCLLIVALDASYQEVCVCVCECVKWQASSHTHKHTYTRTGSHLAHPPRRPQHGRRLRRLSRDQALRLSVGQQLLGRVLRRLREEIRRNPETKRSSSNYVNKHVTLTVENNCSYIHVRSQVEPQGCWRQSCIDEVAVSLASVCCIRFLILGNFKVPIRYQSLIMIGTSLDSKRSSFELKVVVRVEILP